MNVSHFQGAEDFHSFQKSWMFSTGIFFTGLSLIPSGHLGHHSLYQKRCFGSHGALLREDSAYRHSYREQSQSLYQSQSGSEAPRGAAHARGGKQGNSVCSSGASFLYLKKMKSEQTRWVLGFLWNFFNSLCKLV